MMRSSVVLPHARRTEQPRSVHTRRDIQIDVFLTGGKFAELLAYAP